MLKLRHASRTTPARRGSAPDVQAAATTSHWAVDAPQSRCTTATAVVRAWCRWPSPRMVLVQVIGLEF